MISPSFLRLLAAHDFGHRTPEDPDRYEAGQLQVVRIKDAATPEKIETMEAVGDWYL